MACYSVTKFGFSNIKQIMTSIDSELTAAHDTKVYFQRVYPVGTPTWSANALVVYESTTDSDPLANYTPAGSTITAAWRLAFRVEPDELRLTVHAGTGLQYTTSGNIVYLNNRAPVLNNVTLREPPGTLSANTWTGTSGWTQTITTGNGSVTVPIPAPNASVFNEVWLNRISDVGSETAYPMNYLMTMTNRGVFLSVWEDNQEEVPEAAVPSTGVVSSALPYGNSPLRWFLIQRPVDRITGHIRGGGALRGNANPLSETSRCPVFCVFGAGTPNEYQKFVVRENDVQTASPKKMVSLATEDSPAMINQFQQQSLTESGEFVVTFLNNLSTARYRYGDELDMLGTVGAEVIGPGTTINVKVYNEANNRSYTALYSNKQFGTGMRLMVLTAANSADEDTHD